jgi:hypothetical protein
MGRHLRKGGTFVLNGQSRQAEYDRLTALLGRFVRTQGNDSSTALQCPPEREAGAKLGAEI